MTPNEYLQVVLRKETLQENSVEFKSLLSEEQVVIGLLQAAFAEAKPSIKPGGSRAKGTMIKSNYDLDITCYFDRDNNSAGETLEEIFNSVKAVLEKRYFVTPKTSSLRLESKDPQSKGKYTHIDIVPGRFIDENRATEDVFLHQTNGKERLKTNLQIHIEHINDSGLEEVIRLLKIWKMRNGLTIKTFVLELLAVEILHDVNPNNPESCLKKFWEAVSDSEAQLTITDPANPDGNDISDLLKSERGMLAAAATQSLNLIAKGEWSSVFGDTEHLSNEYQRTAVEGYKIANPSAPLPHAE